MTAVTLTALSTRDTVEVASPPGVARQLAATTTSTSTTLTAGIRGVSILARTAAIRFSIGQGAQTANNATSHFIGIGERLTFSAPYRDPRIAVIRDSGAAVDGVLEVTELLD